MNSLQRKQKKKIRILCPIKDEESNDKFINKEVYKRTFKKCHGTLKEMRIDQRKGLKLISTLKLHEVIKDIHAIRAGNYIIK